MEGEVCDERSRALAQPLTRRKLLQSPDLQHDYNWCNNHLFIVESPCIGDSARDVSELSHSVPPKYLPYEVWMPPSKPSHTLDEHSAERVHASLAARQQFCGSLVPSQLFASPGYSLSPHSSDAL